MSLVDKQRASEGESLSADGLTDIGPASTIAGLDDDELAVLRQVGGHWSQALGGRQAWVRALPIDPGLHRFPSAPEPGGGGRFASIDFVGTEDATEIVATPHAGAGTSWSGRTASTWRRTALGPPLSGSALAQERMRKPVALAILSPDALSSAAYGPEAMLAVLALAGSTALGLSLKISVAIVVLMIAVDLSYRQLIRAYPHGGRSGAREGSLRARIGPVSRPADVQKPCASQHSVAAEGVDDVPGLRLLSGVGPRRR